MPHEFAYTVSDKLYARRAKIGRFKKSNDVNRPLSSHRRRKAKGVAKKGEGEIGAAHNGIATVKVHAGSLESPHYVFDAPRGDWFMSESDPERFAINVKAANEPGSVKQRRKRANDPQRRRTHRRNVQR
jgi:hypothetical protein